MIRRTLAVVCLVVTSLGVPAGGVRARQVACGELHESAVLEHDLTCDIRLMGPDITLDLNSFTVDGTISAGRPPGETPLPGEEPVTNSVIRNGKATSIAVAGPELVFLRDLEAALGFHGATVELNRVVAPSVLVRASSVVFRHGVLTSLYSGPEGCGTWVVDHSLVGSALLEADCHFTMRDSGVRDIAVSSIGFDAFRLTGSTVTGSVTLRGEADATLEGNRFTGPGAVLDVVGHSNSVLAVRRTVFEGPRGVSIELSEQGTLDFSENIVRDGAGLSLGFTAHPVPQPPRVVGTIRGNWLFDNAGSGLVSRHDSTNTAYEIAGNAAWNNAGHGIDAPADIDGGGNLAVGNDRSPQCIGVTCRSTK